MLEAAMFRDRAVYFPNADVLVLADVHLGRDRTSNVELPLGERSDVLDRVEALLDRFAPGEVVVAGDLLHAFDHVPDSVTETLAALETLIDGRDARLVVTAGNHDTMLESIEPVRTTSDEHAIGDAAICHGHARPEGSADLYVIGHEHPAITIQGRKRPCHLAGPAETGRVLVLPAFNRLAAGVDVAGAGSFRSPLLGRPGKYRPIVRDEDGDRTLRFPALSEFRSLL